MSFPPYQSCHDSGIEWLGEVPSHWSPTRLRFLAQLNPSKSEVSRFDLDTEVSFVPMEAVGERGGLSLDQTRPIGDVLTGYTYFREGDVSIAKITPCFENGKGAIMRGLSEGFGFGTTELIVVRARPDATTPEFLDWLFRSPAFRTRGEAAMYGAGGQKRVPDDFVRDFVSPGAPVDEEIAIAAFLDREAAKIDALIDEQRRLIALLKEKRQAVISHAVTKGLDPHAPMKDSGIEWLGEVPAHWEVCKLGYHAKLQSGYAFSSTDFGTGGIPLVRMNNLARGELDLTAAVCIPKESSNDRVALEKGDLIWGMSGSIGETGSLGNFARVSESNLPCQLNQRVGRFVAARSLSLDHLEFVIQSDSFQKQTLLFVTGTAQFNVSGDQVQSISVAVPPMAEQSSIAAFLRDMIVGYAKLITEAVSSIDLLNERRSALISAAVTGKIDVRGAVAVEQDREAA